MFTYLSNSGTLGMRLAKNEREDFLKKFDTTLYESQGTILKEYVIVPEPLLMNTDELKKYFEISYEYVKNLKPKQSKEKT